MAVIVANPTQPQKDAMTAQLSLFDPAEVKFIESFEGLEVMGLVFNIEFQNKDFNLKRSQMSAKKTELRNAPEKTYAFFTNSTTPLNFADFIILGIAVSDRIKAGL
jgi:hypothetical protein